MKTKYIYGLLCLMPAMFPAIAYSQFPQIRISTRISDGTDSSRTVHWGLDPAATMGIDGFLGEIEQPPVPPLGTLDGRCWGDSLEGGTMVDLRKFHSNAQTDTFRIRFQPSARGGYPMKFLWSKAIVQQYYLSSVRLIDDVGPGGSMLNIDMKSTDSVVITDIRFNIVRIVASGPIGPNEIRGVIFNDIDGDGVKGISEPPIPGWKVYVGGDRIDSTATDSNGRYLFADLPNGNYLVSEHHPAGWIQTAPAGPDYPISLSVGDVYGGADFGNFQLGSVAGIKFNDQNANQTQDSGEGGISNWKIIVRGAADDTALTDEAGHYTLSNLGPGSFQIHEKQDANWVQIKPGAPGYYTALITSGLNLTDLDFGNKLANAFVGTPGGSWSDSSNWSFGHPPGPSEAVVINDSVIVDALLLDTVLALRIGEGGAINYVIPESLVVLGSVQIDSGGWLIFPPPPAGYRALSAAGQPQLICYGDWSNEGEFVPGGSLITIAGDIPKSISQSTFYDLEIRGENTSSDGNIGVLNTLYLHQTFDLGEDDTLLISSPSPGAIVDTGAVPRGTIKRAIQSGETTPYRFSNPGTGILFTSGGDLPDFMLVTCQPDTSLPSFNLHWEIVGGTADPATNTVSGDSIMNFSKWALGGPRPQSSTGQPLVDRTYTIVPEGGSGYATTLQLYYDQGEIQPGTDESSLKLLRDPQIPGSIYANWNLISVPNIPAVTAKSELFPAAVTEAYRFNDGYVSSPDLEFGRGYWLKFPKDSSVAFAGDGIDDNEVGIVPGWNLIGTISFPVDVGTVVSAPPGIVASRFYGYRGSYSAADVLEPVRGYWVKAGGAGTINLSASTIPFGKNSAGPDDRSAGNVLRVQDRAGREQTLYYTFNPTADRNFYALPPLPPEGAFDVRFGSGHQIAVAGEKPSEVPIQVSSAEYPISIRWEVKEAGRSAGLAIDGREQVLEKDGALLIRAPGSTLSLRLSTATAVPVEFALYQCYPNPFNPVTTIVYALPGRQEAVIRIYNILGEEVATLLEATQEAGIHRVTFDAAHLSSGIYFYRLQAGRHSAIKKMVLLK
ncbi:MAG TPA: SdrD B-like domain-containing protein [Bacteroidota bacterium]|nr:SdrD B-like domain-containing protein [Bacteroidota bacterium]